MPLTAQAQEVHDKRAASVPTDIGDSLDAKRYAFMATWREAGPEVRSVEPATVPGPGGPIPVRIYRPEAEGTLAATICFHGGGFVFGNLDTYEPPARRWCAGAGQVVISVDYRRAPEHPFPAAVEDGIAVYAWVREHADELGIDGGHVSVAGDSAGANIATVTATMARDRGLPLPFVQVLLCPAVDPTWPVGPPDDLGYVRTAGDYWWPMYLPNPEDRTNPYAAPLHQSDLSGLPPALVITAECDDLCAQGDRYAERLMEAGVPTRYKRFDGQFHVFHMFPGSIDEGAETLAMIISALTEGIGAAG